MDNNQVLSFIKGKINDGTVTKEQVINEINSISSSYSGANYVPKSINNDIPVKEINHERGMSLNLTNILYTIGSIIAIVGVGIFVVQNWNSIGFATKLLLTLGISFITYVSGFLLKNKEIRSLSNVMFAVSVFSLFGAVYTLFSNWNIIVSPVRIMLTLGLAILVYILGLVFRSEQNKTLSQAMFVISTILAPLGSYVYAYEMHITIDWNVNLIISLSWSILYLFAYFFTQKRNVVFFINIIYFTWVYMVVITKIFNTYSTDSLPYKWAIIILGLSYIFTSYSRDEEAIDRNDAREKKTIKNILYFAGSMAVLWTSYSFGESFDILYIGLLFIMFYASIFFRSTTMLLVTSGFLIAEIVKLTSRYFVNSIGWPLSLIVIGFLVIGVGYVTFSLNKKYIQQDTGNIQ